MRHVPVPLSVVAVMLLGLVALQGLPAATAQGGTPAASPAVEDFLPPGVTSEFIAAGRVAMLPPTPGSIALFRLTLEPGAGFPPDPNNPTGSFVVVEAGAVTVRSETSPVAEGLHQAGESFYLEPFAATEVRNDGQELLVLLVVNLAPEQQDELGTPLAATGAA